MLRALLWLRWTLAWRATDAKTRIATIALSVLLLLAFSPLIFFGAVGAYGGVRQYGAPVAVVALGVCQLLWIWLGLLSGALGRIFDLEQLIRYPVRTRTVYWINLFATLTEPLALMTLPTLVAVVIATGQRTGAAGGVIAGFGVLLLMLSTAALLQFLLALLDELLRREWMRFVAAAFTSFTFLGVQWVMRDLGDRVVVPFIRQDLSRAHALDLAAGALARIPSICGPATLATAPFTHAFATAAWAGLATVGAIVLSVIVGSRLLEITVLRRSGRSGSSGKKAPNRLAPRVSHGSFAGIWSRIPGPTGLLLAREMLYVIRTPQLLYQLLIPPIMVLFFYAVRHATLRDQPAFAFAMLSTALMGRNLMLFAHDGPGVRTLFLLPARARTVLLAKDLAYLVTVAAQAILIVGVVSVVGARFSPMLAVTGLLGALALLFASLIVGNHYSIAHPSKPASRGFARRGGSGLAAIVGVLVVAVCGGAVVGAIFLTQRLAGPAGAPLAGAITALVLAAIAIALWWISVDRSARSFLDHREKLIEVLAKADPT